MFRLISIISLIVSGVVAQYVPTGYARISAVPTFVNEASKNSTLNSTIWGNAGAAPLGTNPSGQTACSNNSYCLPYTEPALSGNIGIVTFTYDNGSTTTPTTATAADDKSDTYTCVNGSHSATQWNGMCYAPNLAAGAHKITLTLASGLTKVSAKAATFYSVATASPLDVSTSCAGASSTTANCGSVTTTLANDLIYVAVCPIGTVQTAAASPGTGFTIGTAGPLSTSSPEACFTEYGVDASTGSFTPSMTLGTASTYVEFIGAFKASASAGTAPTGWRTSHYMCWSSPPGAAGTTEHFQFPSSGNLLFLGISGSGWTFSTPSDSGNTWNIIGSSNTNGAVVLTEYAVTGAAADISGAINVTTTGSAGDATFCFFDMAGAPASPVISKSHLNDPTTAASAIQAWYYAPDSAVSGNANTMWWYPTPSNGMVIALGGQGLDTSTSLNKPNPTAPDFCAWDGAAFGGESVSGPEPIDENNAWAHCRISAGSIGQYAANQTSSTVNSGFSTDLIGIWGANGAIGILNSATNIGTSGTTLAVTVPSTTSGNLLVVVTGVFNGPTVSKVCLDGATCAAGNSFTQLTGAAATGTGHGGTDIWYLLNAPSGKTTATITYSGTVSNSEAQYFELQKAGGGAWSADGGAHTINGTGSGTTITGPSITTTGNVDFCAAITAISGGPMTAIPGSGNAYAYSNIMFANTSDATGATILTTSTAQPTWTDTTSADSFSASNGCWK